jgi:hypothetical protein
VTPTASGYCDVTVTSLGIFAPVLVRFPVSADPAHLHLVRPEVVRAGLRENSTLYSVLDRFSNPDPTGFLIVVSQFGTLRDEVYSPIRTQSGTAVVWVNFTSRGTQGGELTVLNESRVAIFGPLVIPPLPPGPVLTSWEWGAVAAGSVLAGSVAIVLARRRARRLDGIPTSSDDPEDPLRRLAEGRSHVLSRLSPDQDADLEHLAGGFPGRPPDAAELAEWVGTLVTEGVVRATVGADGRPRFRRTTSDDRPQGPRVEVDAMALDAALARRDFDAAGDDPAPPP